MPLGGHIAVPSTTSLLGPWHHGIRVAADVVIDNTGQRFKLSWQKAECIT